MRKSSGSSKSLPPKPRPDFPLFVHQTGRWCKKVRGKLVYFGKTNGDEKGAAALQNWLDQKDDLLGGRTPRIGAGVTCRDLCNRFLESKELLADSGEITRAHWWDYKATCGRLLDCVGKMTPVDTLRAEDFDKLRASLAKTFGPVSLGNEIQRVRSVFKWGFDSELLERPVRFGQGFKKPSKKVRRLARQAAGPKLLNAAELRKTIAAAGAPLKAMILLGINCGMGQSDLAALPMSRLDLRHGWHSFERPKTGVERRCPLWPETVLALKEAIALRPSPRAPEDAEIVFVTKYGQRWCRCNVKGTWIDSIGLEFRKIVRELKIDRAFYDLRRTFRTVADEAGDQPAAAHIMGHSADDADMSAIYRQKINHDRLITVSSYVHRWLFPRQPRNAKSKRARTKAK